MQPSQPPLVCILAAEEPQVRFALFFWSSHLRGVRVLLFKVYLEQLSSSFLRRDRKEGGMDGSLFLFWPFWERGVIDCFSHHRCRRRRRRVARTDWLFSRFRVFVFSCFSGNWCLHKPPVSYVLGGGFDGGILFFAWQSGIIVICRLALISREKRTAGDIFVYKYR